MDTLQILDRLFDPLSRTLGVKSAQTLVDLQADAELQDRMEYFASRCTEGQLTREEKAEYEALVAANNIIAILQAKARAVLSRRRRRK